MNRTMMVALASLSLAGCVAQESAVSNESEAICYPGQPGCPRQPIPGEQSQGNSLSGDVLGPGLNVQPNTVTVNGVVANAAAVMRGTLFARVDGKWIGGTDLKGATMTAHLPGSTNPVKLHITEVVSSLDDPENDAYVKNVDPSGTTFLYSVNYFDANGAEQPLCVVDDSWDTASGHYVNSTRAFVMPLWYDAQGRQQEGAYPTQTGVPQVNQGSMKAFAFACRSGVSAKCYKWGYMPWLQPDPAHTDQMMNVHWACTRAARADYCGDGVSHTIQNTPVSIWDNVEPQPIRANGIGPWGGFNPIGGIVATGVVTKAAYAKVAVPTVHDQFEGGWSVNGAMCASHLRWNSLPANLCPDRIHSPLEHYEQIDGVWLQHFCDDETQAINLAATDGLLPPHIFNQSDLNAVTMPPTWPPANLGGLLSGSNVAVAR